MKAKYLLRGVGGLVLSALLIFGVAAGGASTAEAQRGGYHGGFHGGGFHGGGFHGRGFHGGGFRRGGFRHRGSRIIISPRLGFGRRHYGYPYVYTYPYYYGDYSHYVFGDSVAADSQGYQDGLKTGSDDAKHDRSYNPERSHYFKDAGYGNFPDEYREGFERGYAAGFGR
jgi:hypothetical protein